MSSGGGDITWDCPYFWASPLYWAREAQISLAYFDDFILGLIFARLGMPICGPNTWWQLRCWNLFFYVGSSGSGKDGVCIGEKRTRTHEMCDVTQEAEFTDEPVVNPFKYEVNKPMKQVVTPTSGFAKSTGSNGNEVGKRNSLAKDSKVHLEKSGTMGLKPGFGSKNTGNARFGYNRSNLNVGVMDFRGVNVVLHNPEPLDIGQMELNEGKSRLVKSGVSNEDEHDSVGEVGLVGMLIDFDASDVEAGQVAF
ncbi:unnamed protein product [Prunus armeniaca]|uniref:Uncharacterized protein n=1 Tax=Prunus armeniaca TaxID=36596 RepID=A0A6J5WXH1_PRUAR|nr:unnamed protein product [Prunus armeniaca]